MDARKIILLVNENQSFLDLFLTLPETDAYDVIATTSGEAALAHLKSQPVDLLIANVQMPGMGGIELFERARDLVPEVPVILITARGFADEAVDVVKRGVFHYFEKPLDRDIQLFWAAIREALGEPNTQHRMTLIKRREVIQSESKRQIIGCSKAIWKLLNQIQEVADLKVTVLIQGETGTGKELVARAIHEMGCRRDYPFFGISCTELSPGVLESELFGHERGSFTGAVALKKGLFEVVNKGTLFLDEISEAPAALQSKLLRVLETRMIKRIGGVKNIPTDFRIIAATNRNLQLEVDAGRFRSDLLYRLNVYTINIPPLRERRDDIAPLAEYYLARFSKTYSKAVKGFTEGALLGMKFYDWPGNVRELVNVVERAVISTREEQIPTSLLPFKEAGQIESEDLSLREMERLCIIRALKLANGHHGRASQQLGIVRKTLNEKIRRYDITVSDYS
ncbi:MAG: sigma-54 dependent transcriptional regulator [Desulfobacterales bacterium]|jgi:two-component system NtrC family response regulator|nr:sigma-54 dependent transcriptional regulator [Desulfobacterales bacterium]